MSLSPQIQIPFGSPILLWGFIGLALFFTLWSALAIGEKSVRGKIFVLRIVQAFLVFTLLFRLSIVSVKREVIPSRIIALIDQSKSMGSHYPKVLQELRTNKAWKDLSRQFQVEYVTFGEGVHSKSLEELFNEKAMEKESFIGEAIRAIRMESKSDEIVLFSDGLETDQNQGTEKDPHLIPIYPDIDPKEFDLSIVSFEVPQQAFLKSKIQVLARIERRGNRNFSTLIRFWRGNQLLFENPLDSNSFKEESKIIEIPYSPSEMGTEVLKAEVIPVDGEVTHSNNYAFRAVKVIRDRAKVLHVIGRATWDTRFLRDFLKESPNIDLVSFFILRHPLNNPQAVEKDLSLIPFPYQDLFSTELSQFDLVIFQNFNFRPYFPDIYLDNIQNYISAGGAFFILGGDLSFGKGGYSGTSFEQILPVLLRNDPNEIQIGSYHPAWTSEAVGWPTWVGLVHSVNPQELPPFQQLHQVQSVQAGSRTLLKSGKNPILIVKDFGKGRVATLLTRSLWKWSFSDDSKGPRAYQRFLTYLFRWLVRDVDEGKIEVIDDRLLGKLIVKSPPKVNLKMDLKINGEPFSLPSEYQTSANTENLIPIPEHEFLEATISVPGREKDGYYLHTAFQEDQPSLELKRTGVDLHYLKQISVREPVGLDHLNSSTFDSIFQNAQYRAIGLDEYQVWESPYFLILFLLLFCWEWSYRRRHSGH